MAQQEITAGKWTRGLFLERFVPKIEFTGHCWLWTGSKTKKGYAKIKWRREGWLTHRLSYAFFNGPLLSNHEIHHSCVNNSCVNPDHLMQCKLGAHHDFHAWKGTFCKSGKHVMEGWNVMMQSTGWVTCRTCHNARQQAYREKRATR